MPADAGTIVQGLTNNERRAYVSYLSTSALVDCVVWLDLRLSTPPSTTDQQRRKLLTDIRTDVLAELSGRQLELPFATAVVGGLREREEVAADDAVCGDV